MFRSATSSARVQRKRHFNAPSHERRVRMSSRLSTELRKEHGRRSLPVCIDDEVKVISGRFKGNEGKVVRVARASYAIFVEKCDKKKPNKQEYLIPIHPSNVVITKISFKGDSRKAILKRAVKVEEEQ
ncbi:Ribosomal protein L26/L24, eukaryotic/archaeal like protein [Aduncisulcus paluster]|uniref:Ribosomal protein L26/L24, eukaryotic/archaeal like protein n=1 Tax=Aduncisulcus paluster TaxID=2918883 RepID=A0ABQ5KAZ3_9EUKA|nr:Ribosomal protein L26/L24, eukaryotic/archaeal like protein [Aduncisulcus paluster]|eukprot:gnl/Carplike_NY0171/98_a135_6574.p1 GENE.gnl/Carplike_NY0171/98_a135_6574~~gnl/Carplike_NY0171/98_a135_6574.p1  ORF type:complete len:128 (-),score=47.44 gnl/Carplike_NY0171/98_a135_6574:43-426(-)